MKERECCGEFSTSCLDSVLLMRQALDEEGALCSPGGRESFLV